MRYGLRQMPALDGCARGRVARGMRLTGKANHRAGTPSSHPRREEPGPRERDDRFLVADARDLAGTRSGDDDEPHAAASQVSPARSVARAFFSSYLAYLYGRLPPARVAAVDQGLRWELERGHATTTPAERASRPRVARLSTTSSGPPVSVVAVAIVTAGRGPASRLTATLELRRRRTWLVVAVAG